MEQCVIVDYPDPNDFLDEIVEYVYLQHFGHFLFIKAVDRLLSKKEEIFNALTVKKDGEIEIIYMWTNHGQYIFGEHTCEESIGLFISAIDFNIAKKTGLFGSKAIIDAVLRKSNQKFNLIKHRLYYSCNNPVKPALLSDGVFCKAGTTEIDELSEMGLDFYKEEFRETGQKTDEEVIEGIIKGISTESIFYWKDENRIVSYVAIIDERNKKIMIGSVFTKPNYRGKGFGRTMVYELIKKNQPDESVEIGFMVNADNCKYRLKTAQLTKDN